MERKNTSRFVFLCCLVYFTSYLTRIDLGAVLVEMISDLKITKELGSVAVTGAFITYGAGQLVSGFLGDKLSPRIIIAAGLAGTGIINLAVSFLPDIVPITVLWFFNGFFQALFWPPLVRLMADRLDDRSYTRACVLVSASSSAATVAVYLLSPLAISLSGWRPVLTTAGIAALLVLGVWFAAVKEEKPFAPSSAASPSEKSVRFSDIAASGIFVIMATIVLQGFLRDGITTWMPVYVKDVFNLGSASSILSAVILPVFSAVSVMLASLLQIRVRNELLASLILFGGGLFASVLMLFLFDRSFVASVFLMALVTGCMHGINLMLISRIPVHFRRLGRVSTVSGALNACTYVGSALSAYGFAFLSERFGWHFVIGSWVSVCAAGLLLCAFTVGRWNRFGKSVSEAERK